MTLLDTLIHDHDTAKRPLSCNLRVWAEEQKIIFDSLNDDGKESYEIELRQQLVDHPDWSPRWSYAAIKAVKNYPMEKKNTVQKIYLQDIINYNDKDLSLKLIKVLINEYNLDTTVLSEEVACLADNYLELNNVQGLSLRLRLLYKKEN